MSVGTGRGVCEVCGKPITNPENAAEPVAGWAPLRRKGANQIILQTRIKGRIAHISCLKTQAYRDQTTLNFESAA